MRQVDKPKISAGINSRRMSGKDPIGLNIDYIEKSIFGYHKKKRQRSRKG